ncbi:MAG: class I SAM-dependent methyltransferase [Egibacteraceae bacterium]
METAKIHLTGEKETLLATLYARALECRSKGSILRDATAESVVRQIDYDFKKFKVRKRASALVAIRAKRLDLWTAEFLADHPNSTVLHLGCGLDSRVLRVDPPATVRWFDLDHPEVIELRRRFYPERDGCRMIGSSVTDPGWLSEAPVGGPVMVVAEGLTMYLSAHDVRQLFERLTQRFSSGQLAFDACTPLGVRLTRRHPLIKATGASLDWGVDDPRELEGWIPRLKLVMELPYTAAPEIAALPWVSSAVCRVLNHIPALRSLGRLLRYQF